MAFSGVLFIFCIWFASVTNLVSAHIPARYDNWAEPDAVTYYVATSEFTSASKQQSLDRVTSLRTVMASYGVDAYIVPTADAHNSQYIAPSDARREWLSGLSGSSGTALVTAYQALVWTDARYWTQFYIQVNTTYWELMRQSVDLTITDWLSNNMPPGSVVGIDPTTYTRTQFVSLQATLDRLNSTLKSIPENLVDLARAAIGDPAPDRPNNPLIAHTIEFSGKSSMGKISDLLTQITAKRANALVLTALDDIAYTLNLRGTDIPYNPVFFSYLIIRADLQSPNNVILFWGNGTLDSEIEAHMASEGVSLVVKPYTDVFDYLSNEFPNNSIIWLTDDASQAVYLSVASAEQRQIQSSLSPVALIKCIKNEVELEGFRSAHIKDGTAVVRALRWVHQQVAAGVNVTEMDMSDKLEQLRAEELYFMGPSFATIAGAGSNGAIIHYKPEREGEQKVILPNDMLLVDSGGQYKDGTTDITRTRHMSSSPTPAQRLAFTRVLKGQILLGTAVFPRGIVGHTLETLARKALWDVGLNYGHGTGHGVGHYLNVHEGPSWILSSPASTDPGISPGMIFSNEPGYYEVGEYGVRHEDLVEVIKLDKNSDHLLASGLVGNFSGAGALGFYTISLVPHQTACLEVDLLNDFEIKYINEYHARVLSTIGPILKGRGLDDDYEWLVKECEPIIRSSTIAIQSTPILSALTAVALWLRSILH